MTAANAEIAPMVGVVDSWLVDRDRGGWCVQAPVFQLDTEGRPELAELLSACESDGRPVGGATTWRFAEDGPQRVAVLGCAILRPIDRRFIIVFDASRDVDVRELGALAAANEFAVATEPRLDSETPRVLFIQTDGGRVRRFLAGGA